MYNLKSLRSITRNVSATYTVVNAVQEITEFLATGFFSFFATGDSVCTSLELLPEFFTVRVLATFFTQYFLRILHMQKTI